jgi:hypothetical protein
VKRCAKPYYAGLRDVAEAHEEGVAAALALYVTSCAAPGAASDDQLHTRGRQSAERTAGFTTFSTGRAAGLLLGFETEPGADFGLQLAQVPVAQPMEHFARVGKQATSTSEPASKRYSPFSTKLLSWKRKGRNVRGVSGAAGHGLQIERDGSSGLKLRRRWSRFEKTVCSLCTWRRTGCAPSLRRPY